MPDQNLDSTTNSLNTRCKKALPQHDWVRRLPRRCAQSATKCALIVAQFQAGILLILHFMSLHPARAPSVAEREFPVRFQTRCIVREHLKSVDI